MNEAEELDLKIIVSEEEQAFRETMFSDDYSKILNVDIKCTVCERNINWMLLFKKQIMVHPSLGVLLCEGCLLSVCSSNSDSCCLWCGSKQSLSDFHECSTCSMKFCSSCLRLNLGISMHSWIQFCGKGWNCFLCTDCSIRRKNFFILRALCDAALKMCETLKKLDDKMNSPSCGQSSECIICSNDLETVVELKCKHKFHKSCLNQWTKMNRSCPMCRSTYVEVE